MLGLFLSPEAFAHDYGGAAPSSAWHWRADVPLILVLLGAIYARGWLRLRERSPRAVASWQMALYLFGLASIGVALLSPIDPLAGKLLTMHMIQHLLLLMAAPLSLLLANPLAAFLWGLPTALRHRAGRFLARGSFFRQGLWVLTFMPVTWAAYVLDLWAWHHPRLYQAALVNQWVHDLQHLLFFSTAVLFWWPVVNPAPRLHGTLSYGSRIAYLIAATLQNTLLSMAISLPEHVLYLSYETAERLWNLSPIGDQGLGGGIMWVSGSMYLIPIIVLVYRLLSHEEERAHERQKILMPKRG